MTEEQRIHKIAEKRVKEWIEYAKKEYGWENAQYDLFEKPMFELCVQVATLAIKELREENEGLRANVQNRLNVEVENIELKKQIKKMKIPKDKMITKFCLFVHTHDLALHGYFTGFYRVKGDEYIGNDSDFNNTRIKFFTVNSVYKKAENLFFDFGLESLRDCIYVCDQTGKKIKEYNGMDWSVVL